MDKTTAVNGLVSCIIPVYNRQELIVECVQSVLAQTYDNCEIIIVDDGSSDQTPQIISKLAADYPKKIRLFTQPNQGPGAARQLGLKQAKGDFIQFLDSDDLLLPKKFELFIQAFKSTEKPDIVYSTTHYYEIGKADDYIIWKQTDQPIDTILPRFFVARIWGTATPIYRQEILINAGNILPLSCEEDLEFECRIGLQKPKLHFINKHLTDIRHHQGDRFSVNNTDRTKQLAHQIKARAYIYQYMREFGLQDNSVEMKQFAQTLFLFARQAGELGIIEESHIAFKLALNASGHLSAKNKIAMAIYKITNTLAGPKMGSKLFNRVYDRLHKAKNQLIAKPHPDVL